MKRVANFPAQGGFTEFICQFPWECFGPRPASPTIQHTVPKNAKSPAPAQPAIITPTSTPTQTQIQPQLAPVINKPGCTAADNAIVAKGHLEGLSKGLGGYGVLRVSKERLEEGALAADQLNKPELANKMRHIAGKLPSVQDPETASRLASELEPVIHEAWDLGRRCKGAALTPDAINKAKELAKDVSAGKLTVDQAVGQLRSI